MTIALSVTQLLRTGKVGVKALDHIVQYISIRYLIPPRVVKITVISSGSGFIR
ncbi:MAG: hypothetical protein ACJAUG_001936 [Halioglobus sp.]|jgi:hypothetical protein